MVKNSELTPEELELLLLFLEHQKTKKKQKKDNDKGSKKFKVLNSQLQRVTKRLLPGAKFIRTGRPMVDLIKKIKRKQRKALLSSLLDFSRKNKSIQRSLITEARKTATQSYS